jgi:DNA polymerase (family 10)
MLARHAAGAAKRLRAPLRNNEIADKFDDIATMLDLKGANPFRARAYRNAARFLRRCGREVADVLAKGESLSDWPGIGDDLAGKIRQLAETGSIPLLRALSAATPPVARELMQIPGLGPRRIRTLTKELHVSSIEQLHRALLDRRVRLLPGFGEKLERYLLQTLAAKKLKSTRVKLAVAAAAAEPLLRYLQQCPGVATAAVAGSFRRGQETVGDLDIVVAAAHAAPVIEAFGAYPEIERTEAAGHTRATVYLRSGLQVDLRVVQPKSYGAALHYFTGSKAHNIALRTLAHERGLKINEYGVFRGDRRIAGATEEEVYASVRLPYIPPELREDRGELEAARDGRLPRLIEPGDLKGCLHAHSLHTDGTATIREMALAAKAHGLCYLAITDHSRRIAMAHGLDHARLRRQGDEIDRLNREDLGIRILKGIEVDINPDGTLDLPDKALARLDIVVAAVHSAFHLSREAQTQRIEKALANPFVSVLAHPTGRILEDREPYDVDMPRLIRAAAAHGVALELNAQPDRLDLMDIHCRMAREARVPISIASDAHAPEDFRNLNYAIAHARRGWLEARDVLNTRSASDLMHHLARRCATPRVAAAQHA